MERREWAGAERDRPATLHLVNINQHLLCTRPARRRASDPVTLGPPCASHASLVIQSLVPSRGIGTD